MCGMQCSNLAVSGETIPEGASFWGWEGVWSEGNPSYVLFQI